MWKYLSLFLCLLSITHVFSLNCYTVRKAAPASNDNAVLENCGELKSFPGFPDLDYSSPSCFTMDFTDPNTQERYVTKGCMPGNSCDTMMDIFKTTMKTIKSYLPANTPGLEKNVEVNCYECKGNECNSASKLLNFSLFGIFLTSVILLF